MTSMQYFCYVTYKNDYSFDILADFKVSEKGDETHSRGTTLFCSMYIV